MSLTPASRNTARLFGLVVLVILLCLTAATPQDIQAAANVKLGSDWIVVAGQEFNYEGELGIGNYDAIYMVQPETNAVHGPFLMNELSTYNEDTDKPLGGDLFDVAVTPDSKTAILSSFNKSLVHFVDISEPLEPVYLSSLQMEFFAEDIAITPDGRYALVTDGGFSSYVVSIEISSRSLAYSLTLPQTGEDDLGNPIYGAAQAVTAARDGTVIVADYFNQAIHTLLLEGDGILTYTGTHQYFVNPEGTVSLTKDDGVVGMGPVNIAIAPDNQTVLVSDANVYSDTSAPGFLRQYTVGVFKITAPGHLEFVDAITGFPHAMQTITFNKSGSKAVLLGNGSYVDILDVEQKPDAVYVMDILGPGVVEFTPGQSADLAHRTDSQLFGVDGLTVVGDKAYATYPNTNINPTLFPDRYISVVDLNTLEVSQIAWGLTGMRLPLGIAAAPYIPYQLHMPLIGVSTAQ